MQMSDFLSLLGGLALFLYGMQMMSSGLEATAGSKMKTILEKLTANRFLGVLVGAGITAVIQSSSATTVMVVGFVNAGLMTLNQAVWIIMGANIGTTVTGLLIALDVGELAPLFAFVGVAMVVFVKNPRLQHIGQILAGLGVLFIGMDMMSSAMSPLRDSESFINLMSTFSNPFLAILAGGLPLLLIAIIQGSIWCNFSSPYLLGNNLFFLTYLIVSSIQMGANIDYAIVISSRYMSLKGKMPLKEAMTETLNLAFPTIITSGAMMALAGMAIGLLTSNEIISGIGLYIGSGTSISIFLVMCVLPQMLLVGDIIIRKTTFSISKNMAPQHKTGLIRIDGRVRGKLNGVIDAEIHGLFRGELTGIVDIGDVKELDGELQGLEITEGSEE